MSKNQQKKLKIERIKFWKRFTGSGETGNWKKECKWQKTLIKYYFIRFY